MLTLSLSKDMAIIFLKNAIGISPSKIKYDASILKPACFKQVYAYCTVTNDMDKPYQ
jgi:hypothetical protein